MAVDCRSCKVLGLPPMTPWSTRGEGVAISPVVKGWLVATYPPVPKTHRLSLTQETHTHRQRDRDRQTERERERERERELSLIHI